MFRIKFILDGKTSWDNFWALKGISFNVEKGEVLGIIGENGAGKSTMLKLIAGMLRPDRGEIKVKGKVSGLLELGAGFQIDLTGRENIYLSASLSGLTQKQIEEKYEEIVNFASLGKFINAPVKCYSQGMFVRLAFSIAIHMDPDILLIDDILAVGDEFFQSKCIKKIFELKEQGKTIIVVTHDTNMLSRLCKRTIFLKEGRIIKDDSTSKVISLYTQTVGNKEGVGILERKPLNLVFNNGRLFLTWQDRLITPGSGAYTAFFVINKWYSSLQANWEVKMERKDKLVAKGKFYQLGLTQIWKLELTDNYEVNWNIEMDLQEPLEIQEGHANILLSNEYTRWFTTLKKGIFPQIKNEDKNWHELLNQDVLRTSIGVEGKESSDTKLPSLAFEQSDYRSAGRSQVLNSDYSINCRVLQYRILGLQSYAETCTNHFIYFCGKIIFNIPDINNYLEKLQDDFTLVNDELKLVFEKGKGILSYDGINLTKSTHIGTSFHANGRWHYSYSAHWEVKKIGESKLIAKGTWRDLPVLQIWEIERISRTSFLWKIDMIVEDEVNIQEQRAEFMCSEDYKHYFSDYGTGDFPDKFLESEIDVIQRCIPDGSIGILSQNNQLSTLSLKFSGDSNTFAKIFNADFYHRARILRIEKVESEEKARFSPGKFSCFAIELNLNEDMQVCIEDSKNILQAKNLSFNFDKGKGCIYWKGIELTKGIGLYTSIRANGRWHDSYSKALWKVKEKNREKIEVFGKWLYLPISQHWEIRLKGEDLLEFKVKMKVDKEIKVDRLQANLMLSERYSGWIADKDKERGSFPGFKADVNDDWDCIWSGGKNAQRITVTEKDGRLPSIILLPQALESDWCLNIINSDIYHQGRVLQYLNSRQRTISPGEYPYFLGMISIAKEVR
jgi:ABC-type polysaccharide/polyol phosphate transport system ATPase subunit